MSSNTGPTPGDIFDVKKVRKFIELMNEHDLAEIDLKQGDQRIRLRRPEAVTMSAMPAMPMSAAPSPSAGGAQKAAEPGADESKFLVIKSPMVGTFYAAPKQGEKPFVSVGSAVNEETDVCIIEAMKVFNEIQSEVSGQIDILSKEVLRLDRVVKTFLDFSRPVEVHLEDVDLSALTREVIEFVTPQAKGTNIQVEFSAPAEPAFMRGDSDLLKQAVLNLVINAVDAMPEGGQLRVSLERGRAEKTDDKLILEVSDTGPGILPELRDKVFQLYFTTKLGGSGIGLAMTYRAVQLHNGTISFKSEADRGTTFRLEFPANVQHA